FAAEGPTEDELATARRQVLSTIDESMKQTSWWAGSLSAFTYRGRNLDDVIGAKAAIESFTANDVKQAFKKYYTPESSMRFTVLPEAPGAPAEDAPADPMGG
ncbi:MAG: hypothetical protein Q8L55_06305, partial [Phycisphaerales bacterium]|nr:hypothetical protein [Phycisphaerales bacterium]